MRRTCLLVIALTLVPVALAGCAGDGETETTPDTVTTTEETTTTETTTETMTGTTETAPVTRITVVVTGGSPKGGIQRPTVGEGDRVVLVVRSDVADEVHVHGYDLSRDVAAGGTARIAFTATIPGRFEVELEERGVQLAEITVTP